MAALVVSSWRDRRRLGEAERLLWIWVLAFFARLLRPQPALQPVPAARLPAVALLLALHWPRIRRGVLVATLVLAALPLVAMAGLSLVLQRALPGPPPYGPGTGPSWVASGGVSWPPSSRPRSPATGVLAGVFLVLLSLSSLLRPLDGPRGRFDARPRPRSPARRVGARRLHRQGGGLPLPAARGAGARLPGRAGHVGPDALERHPRVVVRLRPGEPLDTEARVLGERLDLRGRHRGDEIRAMLGGRVVEHLFVREVLLERPASRRRRAARSPP